VAAPKEYLLYLYAESPVHAGAADSQGLLDLPIQREASTKYPVIWGQSLKGALRQAAQDAGWGSLVSEVFGPTVGERPGEGLDAGRLVVGDAQLVALPVPTLRRTFAWITTGLALARLARKYRRLGLTVPSIPGCAADGALGGVLWGATKDVVLGPCVTDVQQAGDDRLKSWAARIAVDGVGADPGMSPFADKLKDDLLLTGDSLAAPLFAECTEMSVRVQLGEDKTVKQGPFHTEYLPTETILAASLTLRTAPDDKAPAKLVKMLGSALHQIGGDETIGKGLVWCRLLEATAHESGGV
jgi:CRISPR-associated protein Cmr4